MPKEICTTFVYTYTRIVDRHKSIYRKKEEEAEEKGA
jgi:hypothetical protein